MTLRETIATLAGATAGMFLILAAWAAIQTFVRRYSGCRNPDKDVLEFIFRPCGGCSAKSACDTSNQHPHHPEAHHETL